MVTYPSVLEMWIHRLSGYPVDPLGSDKEGYHCNVQISMHEME